jgi:hypothetical protein
VRLEKAVPCKEERKNNKVLLREPLRRQRQEYK